MYEIAKKGNEVVYCKITQINYSAPEKTSLNILLIAKIIISI